MAREHERVASSAVIVRVKDLNRDAFGQSVVASLRMNRTRFVGDASQAQRQAVVTHSTAEVMYAEEYRTPVLPDRFRWSGPRLTHEPEHVWEEP